MSDIDLREAQLVFAELETRWNDERQRTPRLMREVEEAEGKLIKLFMDGWAEHPKMALAYAHYRALLLKTCGRRGNPDNARRGAQRLRKLVTDDDD